MKGKWVLLAVAAVLSGVGAGVVSLRHRQPSSPPAAPAAPPALPSEITVAGKIRAAHVVGVSAGEPGNIDAFLVEVGDEVAEGQELARVGGAELESDRAAADAEVDKAQARVEAAEKAVSSAQLEESRARADAERARAELDSAQKTYDRQKTLVAAGATPRLTYEKAESEYNSARQQWEAVDKAAGTATSWVQDMLRQRDAARKTLTDLTEQRDAAQGGLEAGSIVAPVAGIVVGRSGEVGQPAQELGESLFQIAVDLFELEAVVEPQPAVLKRLRPHQPALVIVPDLQGIGITGEVKEIQDSQAVIGFTSSMPAIRPGMVAEVRLRPE